MKKNVIVLIGALLLAAAPAFAAYDAYMRIDGIPGKAQGTHPGWIHIESFSFGTPQTSARANTFTHPGAQGGGRSEVHELTITKFTDASSPKLTMACASGKHFPEVTLELNGHRTLLQDAIITSVQKTPLPNGTLGEVIHMQFERNVTQQSGPSQLSAGTIAWDKVKTTANATLSGDGGAPAAITLRSVRLVGQNSAIIVVCDAAGGMGMAGLQRAFLTRQRLPMLNIAARGQDATHKDFPATQFTFSNATITGNAAMGGGCNQMSLNFTRYAGPPTFIIIQGGRP